MKRKITRLTAFLLALGLALCVTGREGRAVLEGVYFSAADEQLLDLNKETMPFYSGGELYISNKFFEESDLGVRYVKNSSMGLAVLYTSKMDLRFDLVNRTIYDKTGATHSGRAIEKNGYIFFPVELVCQFFGLRWSLTETETAPLLRLRSNYSVLSDRRFIDAASSMMASRYAAYEKQESSNQDDTPIIHAAEGQKVYLILRSESAEATHRAMDLLGENRATFLLSSEQMADGDLLRAMIGKGHGVALLAQGETAEAVREEIEAARELMRNATYGLLQLVWYEGGADISPVLEELGCVALSVELDRRDTPIRSHTRAVNLLSIIGRHREDLPVYLGYDSDCMEGLDDLIYGLEEAQYRLCAWRLNA